MNGAASTARAALPWFGVLTAFLLVGFFFWLTWQMFAVRIHDADLTWARSMAIYSVIEAFALSAAGALMGVQIQSGRVNAAEGRADAKSQEAEAARKEAGDTKSELGGYRRVVNQARARLNLVSDVGGGGPSQGELEVLRGLLNSVD
ncbi:MAG: hypothetical protein ABI655_04175 [Phenylobacterium sp.]